MKKNQVQSQPKFSFYLQRYSDKGDRKIGVMFSAPVVTDSACPSVFFTVQRSREPFKHPKSGPEPWSSKKQC